MKTVYDTDEVFTLFSLGSKPFPKIRAAYLSKRSISLADREKLVAHRAATYAATGFAFGSPAEDIDDMMSGESWESVVENL